MKVFYSIEVIKFLEKLKLGDVARVQRVRKLFEEYGFFIGKKYIKKLTKSGIWEMRAGKIRVFVGFKGENGYGVHAIYKKSQKTPIKDIKLAENRIKDI